MKANKLLDPSEMTSDILKAAGEPVVRHLSEVFRNSMIKEKCPHEWENSTTVPIYKGKGDPLQCNKYRGLRLLEHGMKLWEKILERRLRDVVSISNNQFGFKAGASTADASFILRQIQQKYTEKGKKLFHFFVDLEKAFDRVPRGAIQLALRRRECA